MNAETKSSPAWLVSSYVSGSLGRQQAFAYRLPDSYLEDSGRRYPLLVLLHGDGSHYLDWFTRTRIVRYASAFELVVACPDGGSGWYTNAHDGSGDYEDDLIHDFVEHLRLTLPVQPQGRQWGIEGLSMGGYGAVKLALKFTSLFSVGVSHSGAFDAPRAPKRSVVFGDPEKQSKLRRASHVFSLAEDALSRWPADRPRLAFDCGTEDSLIEVNRQLRDHLAFIGYPHVYREMPGYHTWPYWDRAFRTALPMVAAWLGAEKTKVEDPIELTRPRR